MEGGDGKTKTEEGEGTAGGEREEVGQNGGEEEVEMEVEEGGVGWRGATGRDVRGHKGSVGDLKSFGAIAVITVHKRQKKKQRQDNS